MNIIGQLHLVVNFDKNFPKIEISTKNINFKILTKNCNFEHFFTESLTRNRNSDKKNLKRF